MRRLRIIQAFLLVGALLPLVQSCSKDRDGESVAQVEERVLPISLDLETQGDEEDLTQISSSEGGRALTFEVDPSDATKSRIAQGSDWSAHVFLKHRSTGAVGYVKYEFEYASRNTSTKKINLRAKSSTVTITMLRGAAPTDATVRSGDWYVLAVGGGGVRDGYKINFASNAGDARTGAVQAPLLSGWTKLTESQGKFKASLSLKPQGSILRVKLDNKSGVSFTTPFVYGVVRGSSSDLYANATYDFSTLAVSESVIPAYSASTSASSGTQTMVALERSPLAANASGYQFVWLATAPGKSSHPFTVDMSGYPVYRSSTFTTTKEFFRGIAPHSGRGNVSVTLDKPMLNYERFSGHALAGGRSVLPVYDNGGIIPGSLGALRAQPMTETSRNNEYGYYYATANSATQFIDYTRLKAEFAASPLSQQYSVATGADLFSLFPGNVPLGFGDNVTPSTGEISGLYERLYAGNSPGPYDSSDTPYLNYGWYTDAVKVGTVGDQDVILGSASYYYNIDTKGRLGNGSKLYALRNVPFLERFTGKASSHVTSGNIQDYSQAAAYRYTFMGNWPYMNYDDEYWTNGEGLGLDFQTPGYENSLNSYVVVEIAYLGEKARAIVGNPEMTVAKDSWWASQTNVKKFVLRATGHTVIYDQEVETEAGTEMEPRNLVGYGSWITSRGYPAKVYNSSYARLFAVPADQYFYTTGGLGYQGFHAIMEHRFTSQNYIGNPSADGVYYLMKK